MLHPSTPFRKRSGLLLAGILAAALGAAVPTPFTDLPPTEAHALMKEKSSCPFFKLIDVRTPAEFAAGAFKGAVNIDVMAPDFAERIGKLDRGGQYLVYCKGGVRSADAMQQMKAAGFQEVFNLAGGLLQWQAEKLPMDGIANPIPLAMPADTSSHTWLKGQSRTTIPFHVSSNRVHLEAEINGTKKVELVLDTGMPAPGVLLVGGGAVKGLGLAYSGEARVGGAGGGMTSAKVAAGLTLRFGDLLLREQMAIVNAPETSGEPPAKDPFLNANGIIGFGLLGKFVTRIDWDRMEITFSDPGAAAYDGPGSRLPLTMAGNFPMIEAEARMPGDRSVPVTLVVDIGSASTLSLLLDPARGIALPARTIPTITKGFGGGKASSQVGRIPSFRLGKHELRNVLADFSPEKVMPFQN